MSTSSSSPSPKPEVFVAIPYDSRFNNIYYVIKKAVEKAGAIPVRVDKRKEPGDILAKAHGYLRKAKAVVAVITDRNANVLYEVGYARALDKSILPVIEICPPDIPPQDGWRYKSPFNVRTITTVSYDCNDFEAFEEELAEFVRAAVAGPEEPPVVVNIAGENIREGRASVEKWQSVKFPRDMGQQKVKFGASLLNVGEESLPPISHAYLHCRPGCRLVPYSFEGSSLRTFYIPPPETADDEEVYGLTFRYRLNVILPPLPPGGRADFKVNIEFKTEEQEFEERFLLRIPAGKEEFKFPYVLRVTR